MKRFIQSYIGAVVLWVLGSLSMGAAISPWVYRSGKALAAMAETNTLPALLEWLGRACGKSEFDRFFDRSLLFSAVILMPLLFRRIKTLRSASATLPDVPGTGVSWKSAVLQLVTGCVIAAGLFWVMGMVLEHAGVYVLKTKTPGFLKLLPKVLLPAIGAAFVEEWLFRGILLGLWLRFARPVWACLGTSLLFSFLHFLKPPEGTMIGNPADVFAGFELLSKVLLHFTNPVFFVTDFATLIAVGLILSWARIRTGVLWFSIGLHAGWILAFKGFSEFYKDVPTHPIHPWGVGDSLRSGMVPLLMLGITAVICHFVLRWFPANPNKPTDSQVLD
ncbi:MAG: CPBP family intramembrane metalloprotease [Gloeobacteraceae cyanobacterium ES-bin-144]|nr:CPBP family intramembrane metalloprotease [Verrucomicrobiales bacterium]